MRKYLVALSTCALTLVSAQRSATAQTLTRLKHQPPQMVGLTFLLTDGTVMAQGSEPAHWFRLTPDANGSYREGTWTELARIPKSWSYAPSAFASAVLADGRVLILGGEYNLGGFAYTKRGGIYDPVADTWTKLDGPPGWGYIGDSPSLVLPGGQFLIGRKLDKKVASLDLATMAWTELASTGKTGFNAEEGWTLLPDGSVFTVDVKNSPNSELYSPSLQTWTSQGSTGVDLRQPPSTGVIKGPWGDYYPPGEMGPQILLPNGTVYCMGALTDAGVAHSAIFTPGASSPWSAGPDFPSGDDAGDASAVLLPSGNVLVSGASGTLYEFDGTSLTPGPSALGAFLMVLPSGQTLVTSADGVHVYTSSGKPQKSWAPTITSVPGTLTRGSSYTLTGTQLNGLSQAAGVGDELETATNYPLVRITMKATGHVFYARTHDHSSMGVATGSLPVTTSFDVPSAAEAGAGNLEVVANGIHSAVAPVVLK